MYQLTVTFDTREELLAYLTTGQAPAPAAGETEKPRRTRTKKDDAPAAAAPAAQSAPATLTTGGVDLGLPAAAAPTGDPLAALLNGSSAGTLPPAAQPAPQPAPVQVTQQDVIKYFVALGQKPGKGPDAIRVVLASLGNVPTVAAIPTEKWGQAIELVKQQLA